MKNKIHSLKVLAIVFILFIYSNTIFGQTSVVKLSNLVSNLDYDITNVFFFEIDSLINDKGDLKPEVKKDFTKLRTSFNQKSYYLLRIGYYTSDTIANKKLKDFYEKIKAYFKSIHNKRLIRIDAVCQSYSNIQTAAWDYEERTKGKIHDALYLTVYKSKTRINKLYRIRHCYFK